MNKGLILVNTGPGKGKTTAALGTTIRALGQGFKVAFLQFIKNQETGESKFLKNFADEHPGQLHYDRLGLGLMMGGPTAEDRAKAAEALAEAGRLLQAGYDLVVLDEICVALSLKLIEVSDMEKLIREKPLPVSLILTGRACPEEIIALADTVTEMRPIKHAYEKGIAARRGIEF